MRKIIIYIGSIFLPDKSAGAHRSLALSKSFRDLGYKVIIVGMQEGSTRHLPILTSRNECEGFETYAVPKPTSIGDWIHHTISIKEFIQLINFYGSENIHSIVAMEYESIALLKLSTFCKRKGIALIADAEEWYEKSRLHFPICLAKDIDTFVRMHYVYPFKIRNMICISRFFEDYYKRSVINRVYIPGTIDLTDEKWKSLPQYCPNDILTIGYAGHPGLAFEKERLDWLINAVCELNNEGMSCKLLIAGVDRDFIEQRLTEISCQTDCIEYKGRVSHAECLKMIAKCDFSAIVREDKRVTKAGFPTKLSESLGCGTPVITTASSNVAEYIDGRLTGVICSETTVNSLKETIKFVSSLSKEEMTRMHSELRNASPLQYQLFTLELNDFLQKCDRGRE